MSRARSVIDVSIGSTTGFTNARPAISGWRPTSQTASVPPMLKAAIDHHPLASRRQVDVGRLGRIRPILPPGRGQVVRGRAVARAAAAARP